MEYNTKADEERAAKSRLEAKAIVDFAQKEGREMNKEENDSFDSHMKEHQNAEDSVNRKRSLNEAFEKDTQNKEVIADKLVKSVDEIKETEVRHHAAIMDYLRNGNLRMSVSNRELLDRAQTVGTNSEGGYTVDTSLAAAIEQATLDFGGVRSVANVFSTSKGGDLSIVTNDDTSNVGELLAESATAAALDTAFGVVTLNAHKYSSKSMLITRELLQDSEYNLVSFLAELMAERIGRITNTHYTTGDGSGKPRGIVTASVAGKSAAATGATTFSELLDLKHSVDSTYRSNATWMFNDSTLVALKKLAIVSANQSLWQPGIVGGAPSTIDGQAYTVNNDMASMATTTKPIIYGDMKKYWVRDVAGVEILRSDELNMLKGQVTFVGFSRTDADLVNTAAIKHMVMA
jgi:HK97 family phage major capsid protein